MKEIWINIMNYERYQVSNFGRIKSLYFKNSKTKERILKLTKNRQGYLVVNLYDELGKVKMFLVHRLVAEHFLDNSDNLPCINHKNELKDDNRVENLEYCSYEYNINYGTARKRHADKLSKPILQYTKDGKFVKEWSSSKEAERAGYHHASNVCNGLRKSDKGYIFKYKDVQ